MKDIIILTNGKQVGNFSSPHSFIFEDESILPAADNDTAKRLEVEFVTTELNDKGDISLKFRISGEVWSEMFIWNKLWSVGEVDVVFCPLPMIKGLHDAGFNVLDSPFRAIKMIDRVNKKVSITQQCI